VDMCKSMSKKRPEDTYYNVIFSEFSVNSVVFVRCVIASDSVKRRYCENIIFM
jgi:hypothetical protein